MDSWSIKSKASKRSRRKVTDLGQRERASDLCAGCLLKLSIHQRPVWNILCKLSTSKCLFFFALRTSGHFKFSQRSRRKEKKSRFLALGINFWRLHKFSTNKGQSINSNALTKLSLTLTFPYEDFSCSTCASRNPRGGALCICDGSTFFFSCWHHHPYASPCCFLFVTTKKSQFYGFGYLRVS